MGTGHAQIPGDEIADWLAKRGAQGTSTCDPPPENILHPRPQARPRPVAPPPISVDQELADDIPPSDDEQDSPVRPPMSQVPGPPQSLEGIVCQSLLSLQEGRREIPNRDSLQWPKAFSLAKFLCPPSFPFPLPACLGS